VVVAALALLPTELSLGLMLTLSPAFSCSSSLTPNDLSVAFWD
jgi:hypothetical protein